MIRLLLYLRNNFSISYHIIVMHFDCKVRFSFLLIDHVVSQLGRTMSLKYYYICYTTWVNTVMLNLHRARSSCSAGEKARRILRVRLPIDLHLYTKALVSPRTAKYTCFHINYHIFGYISYFTISSLKPRQTVNKKNRLGINQSMHIVSKT